MARRNIIEFSVTGRDRASNTLRRVDRGVNRLAFSIQRLGVAFIAAGIAKQLIDAQMAMERFERGLKFATGSAEGGRREFQFLSREAERLGLNLQTVTDQYTKLAAAARGTAISNDEIREVFIGVSEAGRVLGLSADQVRGSLIAVEQMISKGRVSAEELRRQFGERIPGAFQIAANAMNVTTAELEKMLELGELTATELIGPLGRELQESFGPAVADAVNDTASAMERLKTQFFLFKTEIAESAPIKEFINTLRAFVIGLRAAFFNASPFEMEQEIQNARDKVEELNDQWVGWMRLYNATENDFQKSVIDSKMTELEEAAAKARAEVQKLIREQEKLFGLGAPTLKTLDLSEYRKANEELSQLIREQELEEKRAAERARRALERDAEGMIDDTMTDVERFIEQMGRAREALAAGLINPETFERYRSLLLDDMVGTVEDFAKKTKDAFDYQQEMAIQAARNIQSAFADFLFDPFDDGLRGMLKNFIDVMRRMIAELLAFQILTSSFLPWGSSMSALLKREAGGPVASGRPYLVGEKGPELFVPHTSGKVTPGSGMGTTMFQTNIDARGADPSLIARLPKIMEQRDRALMVKVKQFVETGYASV